MLKGECYILKLFDTFSSWRFARLAAKWHARSTANLPSISPHFRHNKLYIEKTMLHGGL